MMRNLNRVLTIILFCTSLNATIASDDPSSALAVRVDTAHQNDLEEQKLKAKLSESLSELPGLKVIDPDRMAAALDEMSLGESGLSSGSPIMGQWISPTKEIVIQKIGGQVEIKMNDIETLKTEYTKSVPYYEKENLIAEFQAWMRSETLIRNLASLKNPDSSLQVDFQSTKKKVRIGEPVQFKVTPQQDCYLTILYVQSNGDVTVLFPNSFQPENKVEAGDTVVIPDAKAGYLFVGSEPVGKDLIKAIVSKKPLPLKLKKLHGTPYSTNEEDLPEFVRGIRIVTTKMPAPDWGSSEFVLEVSK